MGFLGLGGGGLGILGICDLLCHCSKMVRLFLGLFGLCRSVSLLVFALPPQLSDSSFNPSNIAPDLTNAMRFFQLAAGLLKPKIEKLLPQFSALG